MPPLVNKDKQNIWRVACPLYHALCKVRGPCSFCCHVCRAHAQPCLSTGWALNRRFDLTFGTAAVLAQGSGGYTVRLQTTPAHAHKHISNIIAGAVLNVQPFLHMWVGCLVSLTTWAQLACLSGYQGTTILRALYSPVPRVISRTPLGVNSTLLWCGHVVHVLPVTQDTILFHLHRWLQAQAVWTSTSYASWHIRHTGPCSTVCADWCNDFPALSAFTHLLDPANECIRGTAPSPRGRGVHIFPLYVNSKLSQQLRCNGASLAAVLPCCCDALLCMLVTCPLASLCVSIL